VEVTGTLTVPDPITAPAGTAAFLLRGETNITDGDNTLNIDTPVLSLFSGSGGMNTALNTNSQNLTAQSIRAVLTPRTRAIIAVHLAGWPCDMASILALAREHGLVVIEDCAQAHGARYRGRPVGSLGDVAVFSFCQDKILSTAGEGGMLVTDDEATWQRAWAYKDHGKSHDAVYNRDHPPGFRWLHESIGTNWRMTEVQSAIGSVQLRKLDGWLAARRRNAVRLTDRLGRVEALRVPPVPESIEHAYYKYYVFVRPERLKPGWTRDRLVARLAELELPAFSGSCSEIYLEKAFDAPGLRPPGRLPVARELGATSLMFPVHPTLDPAWVEAMADRVARVVEAASL